MNIKYRILKYLTSVFYRLPINLKSGNKYYISYYWINQLRQRQDLFYLYFYCNNVCAYVMLCDRKVCQNCHSKVIETPLPPVQNMFRNYSQVKHVSSKCIGITYTKKVLIEQVTMQLHMRIWTLINSLNHKRNRKNIKKKFFYSLKNNKNKQRDTNNGFELKIYISRYRLRCKNKSNDIFKKQYILIKEMKFLIDQVSSRTEYNMLKKKFLLVILLMRSIFLK